MHGVGGYFIGIEWSLRKNITPLYLALIIKQLKVILQIQSALCCNYVFIKGYYIYKGIIFIYLSITKLFHQNICPISHRKLQMDAYHQRHNSFNVHQPSMFFHSIAQEQNANTLPKQQQFFPVLNLKKMNPLKMKQIYLIKQKQKRQGIGALRKLVYKQLIQNQKKQRISVQKYQQVRKERYGKLSNISFIKFNQRIQHQNRFSTINAPKKQRDNKNQRQNCKPTRPSKIDFQRYKNITHRHSYNEFDDQEVNSRSNPQQLSQDLQSLDSKINQYGVDRSFQRLNKSSAQLKQLQKARINNMILQYRQYEQEEFQV